MSFSIPIQINDLTENNKYNYLTNSYFYGGIRHHISSSSMDVQLDKVEDIELDHNNIVTGNQNPVSSATQLPKVVVEDYLNDRQPLRPPKTNLYSEDQSIQHHLPYHNYAGPGTHIQQNIEAGLRPTSGIDAAALIHDIDYLSGRLQSDADKYMWHNLVEEYPYNPGVASTALLGFQVKDLFGYPIETNPQLGYDLYQLANKQKLLQNYKSHFDDDYYLKLHNEIRNNEERKNLLLPSSEHRILQSQYPPSAEGNIDESNVTFMSEAGYKMELLPSSQSEVINVQKPIKTLEPNTLSYVQKLETKENIDSYINDNGKKVTNIIVARHLPIIEDRNSEIISKTNFYPKPIVEDRNSEIIQRSD